jgi:hypothetical protein
MGQSEYDWGRQAYNQGQSSLSFGTNAMSGYLAEQARQETARREAENRAAQERQHREAMERQKNGSPW